MELHRGAGIKVPLPDDSIDAVIGVHTIYFWPDPSATIADLGRTLRPGGRLVLATLSDEYPPPARFDPWIYHVPTTGKAIAWLEAASFVNVGVERRPHLAAAVWLTATAT